MFQSQISVLTINLLAKPGQLKYQVDFKIHKEEIMCQEIKGKKKEEHKKKTQHTTTNLQIIGLENDTSAREIEGLLGGSVTH